MTKKATCPKEKMPAKPMIRSQQDATTDQIRQMIRMCMIKFVEPKNSGRIATILQITARMTALRLCSIDLPPFSHKPLGSDDQGCQKYCKQSNQCPGHSKLPSHKRFEHTHDKCGIKASLDAAH